MSKHRHNPYEDGDDAKFVSVVPKRPKRKRVSSETKLVVGPNKKVVKKIVKRSVKK